MVNRWITTSLVGTLLVLAGCVVAPPPGPVVAAPPPAPVPQVEVTPPSPGPPYVWVAGHWVWRGPQHGYQWIPGRYVTPVQPGYLWVPGRWVPRPGGYVWVEGHWRRR
ncbi:MAG: YXWGXW repeat-containing protein [Candidatus Rokuibacteriota bacterium]